MAKYSNEVVYNIKTTLDSSGVAKLQNELTQLGQKMSTLGKNNSWGLKPAEITSSIQQINKLQSAITSCFNPKIGMLDLTKFNRTLAQEKISLDQINASWSKMGASGKSAVNSLVTSITTLNKSAITANSTLSKIATTFGNTVRWGVTAGLFQEMMSSLSGAVSYVKELDESLTQIQMVTSNSAEDMRELAQYANQAAQSLATSTTDYTNAIKVFTQEGFSLSESKLQANLSIELANVSEQDTATTADQLTAYRNAFGLSIDEVSQSLDKVANVANSTASNVEELMTAAQRSASVAASVGASEDTFLASIATIQSVTRQSAEEIGNGLKTIYQRFADIKLGDSTDDGVEYGEYAQALQKVGVEVVDASGQFKGMDQILSELQNVWGGLTDTEKIAVGEKVAGKFQYNRFAALMNNQDYYDKAYAATQDASGTMDQMQSEYATSIEGRLKTLQAAGEQVITTMFNQDAIEPILGDVTDLVNQLNTVVQVAGGAQGVFQALGAILLSTFSSQIAEQVQRIGTNISTMVTASSNAKQMQGVFSQLGINNQSETALYASQAVQNYGGLSSSSQEATSAAIKQMAEAENEAALASEKMKSLQDQINEDIINTNELVEQRTKEETEIRDSLQNQLKEEEDILKIMGDGDEYTEVQVKQQQKLVNSLTEQLDIAEKKLTNAGTEITLTKEITAYTIDELEAIDKQNKALGRTSNYVKEYKKASKEAALATQKSAAAAQAMQEQLAKINVEHIVSGFSKFGSAIMSGAFALTSLNSIEEIMNDSSKTLKEKLDACLIDFVMLGSTGAMALSSVTSGIKSVISGLTGMTNAYNATLIMEKSSEALGKESLAVKDKQLAQSIAMRAATLSEAEAKDLVIKKAYEELTAEEIANLERTFGIETLTAESFAYIQEALSSKTAAVSTWEFVAAQIAANAPLLAAVAVIAALTGGLYLLYRAYNADAIAMQEAADRADYAATKYTELKDSYNTLLDSIESYQGAKDALNDLTEGTEEWNAAVSDLNDQVLELLDTYPELAKYITSDKNGVMSISDKGLEELEKAKQDELIQAQATKTMASVQAGQAAKQSAYTDTKRSISWTEIIGGESVQAEISNSDLNTIISLVNQQGIQSLQSSETIANALGKNEDDPEVSAIKSKAEDIANYIQTAQTEDAANAVKLQSICTSILNKVPGEDKASEAETGYAADYLDFKNDEYLSAWQEKDRDTVAKEYAKRHLSDTAYANRQYTDGDSNPFTENGGDTFKMDGEEYRLDFMEQELANDDAQEALSTAAPSIKQLSENIGSSTVGKDSGLGTALSDSVLSGNNKTDSKHQDYDFSNLNYSEGKKLLETVNNIDEDDLADSLGITDEMATIKGYKDTEAYGKAYKEALNSEFSGDASDSSYQQKMLSRAGSLEEFDNTARTLSTESESGLDVNAYAQGLQALTSNYSNCADESTAYGETVKALNDATEAYNKALESNDDTLKDTAGIELQTAQIRAEEAEQTLRLSERSGELAEQYDLDADALESYAKQLKESGDYAEASAEEFAEMAKDQKRYDRAIDKAAENFSDWEEALNNATDASEVNSETMEELGDTYGDLLDVDGDSLSDSFKASTENLELMKEAMNGNEEAYGQLQENAGKDILASVGVDTSQYETDLANVHALAATAMGEGWADIEAGASIQTDEFLQGLTDMVNAAGMTADEATSYLSSMGIDAEVEEADKEVTETVGYNTKPTITWRTESKTVSDGEGNSGLVTTAAPQVEYKTEPVEVTKKVSGAGLRVTSASKSSGGGVKFNNSASSGKGSVGSGGSSGGSSPGGSGGGSGGGGGGGSTKKKRTDEADKNERDPLIEIENAIDRQTAVLEEQDELSDELYGSDKIANLNKVIASHEKLADLYEQELTLQEQQIALQQNQSTDEYGNLTVKGLAEKVGMTVEYNEDDDITNGKQIQEALYNAYKQAYDEETEHSDEDDYSAYTEEAEKWKDLYDQWVDAESSYGDMIDNMEDINSNIRAEIDAIQDANDEIVEALHEGLDNWIDLLSDIREFKKTIADFENGASLDKFLDSAVDDAVSAVNDILQWSGTGTDLEGNAISLSLSNEKFSQYAKVIEDINEKIAANNEEALKEFYDDNDPNYTTILEAMKGYAGESNGTYDWSKAESVFDKGNLEALRDYIAEGDSDKAQTLYDKMYKSIMQNSSRSDEEKLTDIEDLNNYIADIKKSYIGANEQNNEWIKNSKYTSLTGNSSWTASLTQLSDRLEDAKTTFADYESGKTDGDFSEDAAYSNLTDALETAQNQLETMIEAVEDLRDSVGDGIDKMADLIESQSEKYDSVLDRLSSLNSISDLVYGENSNAGYETKIAIADASIDALSGKISTDQVGIDAYQSILDTYQAMADAQGMTLEELKQSNIISESESEAITEAQDNITELQQDQIDSEEELLENLISKLETQANQSADALANQLLGGNVSWMEEEWEMQTRNEELYLDDMNRAYNIQKLQYSYQELLNDSSNQNALIQQQISSQMSDQLAYLQEKTELSQTDIDYANAQLTILEKQIALQDAQENKTQMRLQRDSTGNYSYVYTADEDDLAQKQQDLLDAQINAYNIAKEGLLDAEKSTIDEISNAKDQIVSIWTDASLAIEERQARVQEVMDSLGEYTNARSEQIKTYSLEVLQQVADSEGQISEDNAGNLTNIYDTMEISLQDSLNSIDERFHAFADYTGQEISNVEGGIAELKTSMQSLAEASEESSVTTLDNFSALEDTLVEEVSTSLSTFETAATASLGNIGAKIEEVGGAAAGLTNEGDGELPALTTAVNNCAVEIAALNGTDLSTLRQNLSSVVGDIDNIAKKLYGDSLDGKGGLADKVKKAKEEFSELYTSVTGWLKEINEEINGTTISIKSLGDAVGDVITKSMTTSSSSNSSPASSSSDSDSGPQWSHVEAIYNAMNSGSAGNGSSARIAWATSHGYTEEEYWKAQSFLNKIYAGWGWSDAKSAVGFYTGGYTGNWYDQTADDKNGKLAILHQKELVLNASDTENLLDIIKQVRQMQDVNLSQIFDVSGFTSSSSDTIEQRVEITAEFPSVTSSQEIEQALLNLADSAYQAAHKTY